ncbi:MAG TPA: aminotransferase class V-fold PLP-dependent enzyme, partial [Actinomycetota bacterium]|nr:aminotransferase class V-fold PLP-dependent enzyme [Actinomycetota bacterium]
AAVDDATAAICVSHVQYLTGHRFDLGALVELARAHDAMLIVDATQSAGQVPIDVTASDVDVLISGSYKWLCSTFGAAVCYLSPAVLERFRPPLVGWKSTTTPYDLDARWKDLAPSARRMEFSTMSYAAGVALGAAIEYVLDVGPEAILRHNLGLATRLIEGLDELGATLLTPREDDRRAGAVTARFPGADGEAVAADLTRRGVIVSPRVGSTRFSPHFYNTEDDVDAALETLAVALKDRRDAGAEPARREPLHG